jgi:amidase
MAAASPLTAMTARALVRAIRDRTISPVEVLDAHLVVIGEKNPALNAIVTLAADKARAAAKAAEERVMAGEPLGPLHGLPIVIKDVTETAGIRTTYGSPLYRDHVPDEDAEVVARLRRAGAIILGKTNTPEFAAGANTVNRVFGATRNPWNSAVAVAAGMVPLAHGTDFGCSIRVPAAFCGIVGLRPTGGLVPNRPMPLYPDYGQVHGPLARTAEDAALMLDAMTGLDPLWPGSVAPPWGSAAEEMRNVKTAKGLRIAFIEDLARIGVDAEVARVVRQAVDALSSEGAEVEAVAFDASEGITAYETLRGAWMVGQQLARIDDLDVFGAALAGNVRQGLALGARELAEAAHIRDRLTDRFRELLERYDVLVTPAAPILPYPVEMPFPDEVAGRRLENYIDWIAPAFLITLVGFPAISVPAGLSSSGLPVGMQVIGRRFDEPRLLGLAEVVQRLCPAR